MFKLVLKEHITKIIPVKYVTVLVIHALVAMIMPALNVQMDFFQMKHLLLKALKNVSRHALQEQNKVKMDLA